MFTFASFILPNSIYCRWDSIILSVVSSSSWLVVMVESLHGKLYFLFPDVLKRWSCAGVWSFSYYWERSCFSFLKTFSFSFFNPRWKMKDDLFQKNTRKYDIFFRSSEKKVFLKGPRRDMIFLVLSGKMVFFSRKHIFFLGQEASDNLSQEIHGNMTFFVYTCSCYKPDVTPAPLPCQEKSRMALSPQNTPKGDWSSRLTSWKELQQFFVSSQRPLRAFSCIAIQRKKKQET